MATPQDKIIEQLESDIERMKLEIFELKGDNKVLRMQLKECSEKLQEQVGYYDADGNNATISAILVANLFSDTATTAVDLAAGDLAIIA